MLKRTGTSTALAALLALAGATAGAEEAQKTAAADESTAATATSSVEGAVAPPPADASTSKKKKRSHRGEGTHVAGFVLTTPWRVGVGGGALIGEGTLRAKAALMGASAAFEPEVERGIVRVALPLAVDHRETVGASLRETDARAGLDTDLRFSPRLRVGLDLKLRGLWRPDWPDQYQPTAMGMATSDRFSHLDAGGEVSLTTMPFKHQHVRLEYGYQVIDYANDPNFDAIDEPTHLVPADHGEHQLGLSWRHFAQSWKLGGAVDFSYQSYDFARARDAGTGKTHATPGGPPPNPLYQQLELEPALVGDVELADGHVEIDGHFGWEIVDDVYQGYYSYSGPHPEMKVAWRGRLGELTARADLKWRTYGPNSYAVGPDHPALEFGDRRVDRRFGLTLGGRLPVGHDLALLARSSLIVRRSNFPDYVPGVFPSTRAYEIDWDYNNVTVEVGVEWAPK